MRARCCVCFNLLDSLHIAACPCGHTFHEECLIRWIDMSSSCPSCRTPVNKDQITKRLFFDIHENCSEHEHVERLLDQINNLKVQLNETGKKIQKLTESKDRLSTMLADSEAARELLFTKLNEDKDVMKRDLTVMLKENTAFIEEMEEFKQTQRDLYGQPDVKILIEEFENEIQDICDKYNEHDEPSLKHLARVITILKREYKQVVSEKSVLQEQVAEVKLGERRYKQKVIILKKNLKITKESLNEELSQKTILQKQVSVMKHYAVLNRMEFQKYKHEVVVLRRGLENTHLRLCLMMNENDDSCHKLKDIMISNEKTLRDNSVYTFPRFLSPNIHDCVENKENTNTCMLPDLSDVPKDNQKRKFVSKLDEPESELKLAKISAPSKHTKSETVDGVHKVSQTIPIIMQKEQPISEHMQHQSSLETLTCLKPQQHPYSLRSSKNQV